MPALVTDTGGNFVPQYLKSDGSAFEEIKGGNGSPYVQVRNSSGTEILTSANPGAVALTGSNMELFGATFANRPAANTVSIGATFLAIDTQKAWQSDGANWREI